MSDPIIPSNQEHLEAHQANLNQIRAEKKAKMSPEGLARMEAIEKAVHLLEEVKIPFLLWGNTSGPDYEKDGFCYWQFHRFCYSDEPNRLTQDWHNQARRLHEQALEFHSLTLGGAALVEYWGDNYTPTYEYRMGKTRPLCAFAEDDNGQVVPVPLPEPPAT